MSKVYLALQDNDMSRYIVAAVEADNPGVTVIYQPAMVRMEREDSLTVRRSTVEAQLGQSWDVQELHLNLITLGGNVEEDDEAFSLSWVR
ncbi:MmoB/DmpM family protein [Paralysiella testudinis]|uniref:MmoB/DmpM family protein n=1 Tax=Paralysiella testudinis TaxID=2809020 RepID=A0A892ZM86_9NEIS|nr:MmoB/DmpM family protein [Paralysiella testudinis]QRQ82714.1 MmoB/DmpM family protein [Paralysiella testudinis]